MIHTPHSAAVASLLMLIVGCGSDDAAIQPPSMICTPGSTQVCICPNEQKGAQACAKDGMSWGTCSCMPADAGPVVDAGIAMDAAIDSRPKTPDAQQPDMQLLPDIKPDKGLPPCKNGIKDGDETDIDCGGMTCNPCPTSMYCKQDSDCVSLNCQNSVCFAASCFNVKKDGYETDVDCGGSGSPPCPRCADGKTCNSDSDCAADWCYNYVCTTPTCTDSITNGTETDVDCGGDCPNPCVKGQNCKESSDCVNGACWGGVCAF